MAALESLAPFKDNHTIDLLIQALNDKTTGGGFAAIALIKIGEPAVEPLIRALEEGDSCTRVNAASSLGKIGDASAIEPLTQALKNNDSHVQSSAEWALKQINASSKAATESSEPQMNSSSRESREILDKASQAIESRDTASFIETMSNDTLKGVNGKPDLSTPQAAKIAEGLKEAKVVDQRTDLVVYEMTIDGIAYSFFTVKEDGAWKISGL